MEYITIDFETANSNLSSACSVGLVGVDNGKIVFEKYYLINPQEHFSEQNISIHGITERMVENQPSFPDIWNEIFELINGEILVAHSATFDIEVLKSLLDKYNLKYPNIKIGCTLKLSRIAYKDVLPNFRLGTISNYLEVEHNHHNAMSDALICYYLIERLKRMYQVYTIDDLFETVMLSFGELNLKFYRGCTFRLNRANTRKNKTNRLEGKIIAFTGKPKLITKTEVKNAIISNGGLYSREINLGINTFIVFTNPEKAHLQAIGYLQSKKEILILNEEEFLGLIRKNEK